MPARNHPRRSTKPRSSRPMPPTTTATSSSSGLSFHGRFPDRRKAGTTQPLHMESMRTVHAVLTDYLAGRSRADAVGDSPHAAGFIRRTYDWLGPLSQFTEVQRLMLERMLLTVEYFTRTSDTIPVPIPRSGRPRGGRSRGQGSLRGRWAGISTRCRDSREGGTAKDLSPLGRGVSGEPR